MQPLKISILGNFWDSRIYFGRLYLWKNDGSLKIYDWGKLIDNLCEKFPGQELAIKCAFAYSSYLYDSTVTPIIQEPSIKKLIQEKIKSLSNLKISFAEDQFDEFLLCQQDVPLNEIPIDTEIYDKKLFFTTDSGFYSATAHRTKSQKYLVSTKAVKIWDGRSLSINAGFGKVNISAGSEGLYQHMPEKKLGVNHILPYQKKIEKNLYRLSAKHSLFSDWNQFSIYNSSTVDDSFLILNTWTKSKSEIRFRGIFEQEKIFSPNHSHLSWGLNDKLFKPTKEGIEMVKFDTYSFGDEIIFSQAKIKKLTSEYGQPIYGGLAPFGTIIEYDSALRILLSNNTIFDIPKPVIRWRVFPRSVNFENQLHVILDDRLEILSFNHDYFENQELKFFGISKIQNKKKQEEANKNLIHEG